MIANLKTALIVPAVMIMGLFGLTSNAKAGTWEHIDQLALRLEQDTEVLHDEAHDHFRQTPIYAAFDRNVDAMEKIAAQLHALAHGAQCPRQLSGHIRTLTVLQHQTEHLLGQMGRWGHLDPVAYRHLGESLQDVGVTLRHLKSDLRALEHNQLGGYPPIGQPTYPGVQPFPSTGGQPFPIGNPQGGRGIQIRFGFRR